MTESYSYYGSPVWTVTIAGTDGVGQSMVGLTVGNLYMVRAIDYYYTNVNVGATANWFMFSGAPNYPGWGCEKDSGGNILRSYYSIFGGRCDYVQRVGDFAYVYFTAPSTPWVINQADYPPWLGDNGGTITYEVYNATHTITSTAKMVQWIY